MAENKASREIIEFSVPEDFNLPMELIRPVPRQLPKHVTEKLKAEKLLVRICLGAAAAGCFGLARLTWIKLIGLYFLPMAYLDWIGGGLAVILLICLLHNKALPLHLRLFQNGIPVPARIDEIVKQPGAIINGVASQHAYYAAITLRLPGETEPCCVQVQSQTLPDKNACDCTFKVGDYVPALCLPGKSGMSINLYGFLGVDEQSGMIKKQSQGKTSLKDIGIMSALLLAIPGFFLILFWNVYAYGRYSPLDADFEQTWPAFAIGGILGFLGMTAWGLCSRRQRKKIAAANLAASERGEAVELHHDFWSGKSIESWFIKTLVVIGMPFLGALIIYCWAISLNALLDDSEAQIEIADVDHMVMKTHSFLFREYIIKYHFPNEKKQHSFMTTPYHIMMFGDRKGAAVAIHRGAFGWKWVKKIAPL